MAADGPVLLLGAVPTEFETALRVAGWDIRRSTAPADPAGGGCLALVAATGTPLPADLAVPVWWVGDPAGPAVLSPDAGGAAVLCAVLPERLARLAAEEQAARRQRDLDRLTGELRQTQVVAGVGSYSWDVASGVIHWSPEMIELWGLTATPRCQAETLAAVHPDDRERVAAASTQAWQAGEALEIQYRLQRPDGSIIPVMDRAVVEYDAAGQQCRLFGTVTDLRSRTAMQVALEESEERYRAIVEHAPIGVLAIQDGVFVYANRQIEELLGHRRGALQGMAVESLVAPACLEMVRQRLSHALAGGRNRTVRVQFRLADGDLVEVEASSAHITLQGRPAALVLARDIREQTSLEHNLQLTAEKYRTLFDTLPMGVTVSDATGNILEANAESERLLGITTTEHAERQLDGPEWSIVRPDGSAMPAAEYASVRALRERQVVRDVEMGVRRPDGQQTWLNVTAAPLPLASHGVIVVYHDTTAAKAMTEALRQSEARLTSILRVAPVGIGVVLQRRILQVNDTVCSMADRPAAELVGQSARCLYPSEAEYERVGREKYESLRRTGSGTIETQWVRRDGSLIDVLLSSTPLDPGNLEGEVTFTALDITASKRSLAALQQRVETLTRPLDTPSDLRLRDLFDVAVIQRIQDVFAAATGVASVITDPSGQPITQPSNFCRLCAEVIRGTAAGRRNCFHSDAVMGTHHPTGPVIQPCLSGGLWDAGASITVGGHHIANWLIGQVCTETQDEAAMLAYARQIGADEEAFREALSEVRRMPLEQFQQIAEALFVLANELGDRAFQTVLQARFITERERSEQERLELERRLLHAQKLESLGVLAGGIAHDFNNLLMAVLGNLDLARRDLPPDAEALASVDEAISASQRAAELTQQMLAYSGRGHFAMQHLDLGDIVRRHAELVRAAVPRNVAFEVALDPALPLLWGDPAQVQQVVMNLVGNAAEAIGDRAGTVRLTTGHGSPAAAELARSRVDLTPIAAEYVWLEVSDDGCGMDGATLERLFEPFFTTKFTGRGLGLAAVEGIVRGHHGGILVDSTPGRGTTIRVLFPRATTVPPPAVAPSEPPARGAARLLVADDEESVRRVCRRMLERMGYEVQTAADGAAALAQFDAAEAPFDLVLLDLTMPTLDGVATSRELLRRAPGLPILLASGYGEAEAAARFSGDGLRAFLQKPFDYDRLAAAVAAALASPTEP
ncbi:MAG: PAS domain S-box protein [Fimbriimonadaceae bacterium]|nr:PAS domain S-box protein [Fimbriimonadaceae bacterium]